MHYRFSIRTLGNYKIFIAGDVSPFQNGFLLRNESSGDVIDLGKWTKSQEVEFPAAFGILNPENGNMRITALDFIGLGAWDIVLHENETRPTTLPRQGILEGGSTPPESCGKDGAAASLLYYRAGVGPIVHTADGFVLDNASKGDGYDPALTKLVFHVDYPLPASQRTAAFDVRGERAVWADPPSAASVDSKCGAGQTTVATSGGSQSNIIWVSFVKKAGHESPGEMIIEEFDTSLGTG